jgi:hypothetical protein
MIDETMIPDKVVEAAKVADDKTIGANTNDMFETGWVSACDDIAAAIRAMIPNGNIPARHDDADSK